jgi:hypothetical protein
MARAAAGFALALLIPAAPAAAQTDLVFTGEPVLGTIYLQAGQSSLNAELYRTRGSLSAVERITKLGRVSMISALRDRLAVSNALGSGADRLELARLGRNPVLPGRLVDSAGQAPVYSPRGKLLFVRQRYTDRSVRGELYANDFKDRIAQIGRDGKPRVLRTDWFVYDWSPDGSALLVGRRDRRLGLMSPVDGSVRELGRYTGGTVYAAVWGF